MWLVPWEGCALERWAAETPAQVYAVFEDAREWTFAEASQYSQRLASLDVLQGDHVATCDK